MAFLLLVLSCWLVISLTAGAVWAWAGVRLHGHHDSDVAGSARKNHPDRSRVGTAA